MEGKDSFKLAEKSLKDAKYFASKGDVFKTQEYIRKAHEVLGNYEYSIIEKEIMDNSKFNHVENAMNESKDLMAKREYLLAYESLRFNRNYAIGLSQKLRVYKRLRELKPFVADFYLELAKDFSKRGEKNFMEEYLLGLKKYSLLKFFSIKKELRHECAENELEYKIKQAFNKVKNCPIEAHEALALNIPSIEFFANKNKLPIESRKSYNEALDFMLKIEIDNFESMKNELFNAGNSRVERLNKAIIESCKVLNQYSERLNKKFEYRFDLKKEASLIDDIKDFAHSMKIFD